MEDKQTQEVDMIDIVKSTSCFFFQKIGVFFTNILRITYNYKLALLIIIILAGVGAFYKTSGSRRTFKGDLTLKINAGTSYMVADMMNELNEFVKHNDNEGLAEALKISKDEAENVDFIKSYYSIAINKDSTRSIVDYDNHYDIEDTLNLRVKNKLTISLGLKDRQLFGKMQSTIIDYINSNNYLKELHQKKLEALRQREKIIDCDLNRLDSLQKQQFFKNQKNEVYLSNLTELHSGKQDLFYVDKQNLLDKKETLLENLASNVEPTAILNPFHPSAVSNVSFVRQFVKNFLMGYVLFLIVGAFIKYRKDIKKYLTKEE